MATQLVKDHCKVPSNLYSSMVSTIYGVVFSIYLMPAIENSTNQISVAQNAIKKIQVQMWIFALLQMLHWLCTIVDVPPIFVEEGICVVGWVRGLSVSYTCTSWLTTNAALDRKS